MQILVRLKKSNKKLIIKNKKMKKNNTIKVIEGGLVGMTLGVAAGIMLAPESGKKFRGDIKKKSAEFYAYLAPKLKKIKKVGEEEYDSFLNNAIKSFAKTKHLSKKEISSLVSQAKKSWKHIKKT